MNSWSCKGSKTKRSSSLFGRKSKMLLNMQFMKQSVELRNVD